MSQQLAQQFIEALGRLEADRDAEPMTALYAAEAEVGNVVSPEKFKGPEGAREFWTKYRETFGEVRSAFRNQLAAERSVALEWTTEGTTAHGHSVRYDGVSVIEHDGQRITRFRAYFNAEDLSRQIVGGQEDVARSNTITTTSA